MKQIVCTQLCLPFVSLRYIISRQVLPFWPYRLENILVLPNMNTELAVRNMFYLLYDGQNGSFITGL